MTGRDLIIYILANNLENAPVFKDGKFIGFLTVDEAAERMHVGNATIRALVELGKLDAARPVSDMYIPVTCNTILGEDSNV